MSCKKVFDNEGEQRAGQFLLDKKPGFFDSNNRNESGQTGLVFTKKYSSFFCEVKTRSALHRGQPEGAISTRRVIHIDNQAKSYLQKHEGITNLMERGYIVN